MKYVGSKNRVSKELAPIIHSYIDKNIFAYIEPFVGGANMIDKIDCHYKIGSDIDEYLIELLQFVQDKENIKFLPNSISEEEYITVRDFKCRYAKWYVGLVGFCATFGAKFFGGYARDKKGNRCISNESIRNLIKQAPLLVDINFSVCSYTYYSNFKDCVIYCDPPYKGTLGYNSIFDHDDFYKWCIKMAKNNTVLVSEYNIKNPHFVEIWKKGITIGVSSINDNNKRDRVEKLYFVKS